MCNANTNTPVKELHTFEVLLVRLDRPDIEKTIQVQAENAIKACIYAEEINPGWLGKSSDII